MARRHLLAKGNTGFTPPPLWEREAKKVGEAPPCTELVVECNGCALKAGPEPGRWTPSLLLLLVPPAALALASAALRTPPASPGRRRAPSARRTADPTPHRHLHTARAATKNKQENSGAGELFVRSTLLAMVCLLLVTVREDVQDVNGQNQSQPAALGRSPLGLGLRRPLQLAGRFPQLHHAPLETQPQKCDLQKGGNVLNMAQTEIYKKQTTTTVFCSLPVFGGGGVPVCQQAVKPVSSLV